MQRNNKVVVKKIALFVPSLKGGGAERAILNLANELSKDDCLQVDLVLSERDGPYLAEVSERVRLIDLKSSSIPRSFFPLVRYLRAEKPAILISTLSHASVASIVACMFSGSGTKTIVRMANTLSEVLKNISFLYRIILLCGVRTFFRFADELVAVSGGVADDLSKRAWIPRNRIKVIYNSVDLAKIEHMSGEDPEHPWLKDKKNHVIIAVGRLTAEKNYPELFKAFKILIYKKDARLIVLGEGKKRDELEVLAKKLEIREKVDMPGFVRNPYAYIKKADVYVLSSNTEGMPNTLLEAMACGVPVVSTDCPSGPREILDGGKYGKLVEVGDHEALAEAILETINNSGDPESFKERIRMDFSLEKATEKYLGLIRKHLDI